MNIVLDSELEKLVVEKVRSDEYETPKPSCKTLCIYSWSGMLRNFVNPGRPSKGRSNNPSVARASH